MTSKDTEKTLSVMKSNIEWLKTMEEAAASLYSDAARLLTPDNDPEMHDLLLRLSKDEEEHARLMALALEVYKTVPSLAVSFEIDDEIKAKHKAIAQRILNMIDDGTLTGYGMLDAAIELEHAELNGLFTYVTESLKEASKEFVDFSIEIEKHKKSIERFIRLRPEYEMLAKKIPALPKVWHEKILVVDKSEPFIHLMEVVLTKEGRVSGTSSGKEALQLITDDYFDLIITDIHLLSMDGMEFYREAVKTDTTIKDRVLFLSSTNSDECIKFFEDEKINYLIKPASIKDIVDHSIGILTKRKHL